MNFYRIAPINTFLLGSRTVRTFIVLTSFVLCRAAQAQSPQTNVFGSATACGQTNQYNITGKGDLSHSASKSCSQPIIGGSASASSSASLDVGLSAMASSKNVAAAASRGANGQTATLKPPKGFTGKKVTFSFADAYAINLSGAPLAGSQVRVCWDIPQLKFSLCEIRTTVGENSGSIHQTLILTKSSKGFQLTFAKEAASGVGSVRGGAASGGAATSSVVSLTLPKGWKCTYDSGTPCP